MGWGTLSPADQAEQEWLGPDGGVTELQGLAEGQCEHLLGARREGDVATRGLLALADDLLDLCTHCLERDVQGLERLRSDSLTLVDQAEEDVLGSDVVVGEHACLFLGKHDHPAGSVGEPFEHVQHSSTKGTSAPDSWDADLGTHVCFRPTCSSPRDDPLSANSPPPTRRH